MFTGIIEAIGEIKSIRKDGDNLIITVISELVPELTVDQSLAHNGVCLTVEEIQDTSYTVTAIRETIQKSNMGFLKVGDFINLERAMKLGDRLDGHMVQGHVDQIGTCMRVEEANGSWYYTFQYDSSLGNLTIEKGSVTINGVSLTVVNSKKDVFEVAIIPYTYHNTNFKSLKKGSVVNLEFDVIGKYISKLIATRS
jgi:riboflavin synthase